MFFKLIVLATCIWLLWLLYNKWTRISDCAICGRYPVKTGGLLKYQVSCSNPRCKLHNIKIHPEDWKMMTSSNDRK